ncbi:MAG: DUF2934 domain-containing protein [Gemmobacter sp.]|uniref:DUF2934 domain-containing protein n=1 Tax=Gemmobacter sp. TaxID=1898957 RepID=UPI001A51CBE8|nr:DUF2934 domain-containing protein [Gemmobacter sp.]MBL8562073.1 DUF2934 domain-containing protein [Gemmobacter sp.]
MAQAENHQDTIRQRAYALWQSEGCPEGCADRHWQQAEQEMQETGSRMASGAGFEAGAEFGAGAERGAYAEQGGPVVASDPPQHGRPRGTRS